MAFIVITKYERILVMDININSPKYYKDVYGIEDDIYRLCQDIFMFFKNKSYSEVINIVGIIPIIAPKQLLDNGTYKEVKMCSVKYGFADVNLFIDIEEYADSSMDKKKQLIIENVLKSIKAIKGKGKIKYDDFEHDMFVFCKERGIDISH